MHHSRVDPAHTLKSFVCAGSDILQVLDFSRTVHRGFDNYDPAHAWPVLLDDFAGAPQGPASSQQVPAVIKASEMCMVMSLMLLFGQGITSWYQVDLTTRSEELVPSSRAGSSVVVTTALMTLLDRYAVQGLYLYYQHMQQCWFSSHHMLVECVRAQRLLMAASCRL